MADGDPQTSGTGADIRTVAAAAGVALSTASNALNGRGRVSAATRERVLAAAGRLQYRPNPSAKLMRAGRSGMIGVRERLPDDSGWRWDDLEFIVRLVRSCCSAAWDRGYYPVMLPTDDSRLRAHPSLDAVIVIDPLTGDDYLQRLDRARVPVVTMGRDASRGSMDGWWVDNDKAAQARTVLDGFRRSGARRMAMISAVTGQSYMTDNVAGFRRWCADRGAAHEVHEMSPSTTRAECYRHVRELCSRFAPDAIYVVVEALVQPVIDAVIDSGLRIPEDVRIATSSDSAVVRHARTPVTTFDLDPESLGRALVDLVHERLDSPAPAAHRIVPYRLIEHPGTSVHDRADAASART